ncbi:MAG: hypothetical protein KQH67_10495 [Bacteroidetes bacterium]|nr:hypothetical protein [Bacteroidota bacterium]
MPINYTIKADNYTASSNERQLLSSLSINNIKNIHQIRIHLKADLLLNVQRDDENHLFAYIKVVHPKLTGETSFRNFPIDTLLVPLVLDGRLSIHTNNRQILEIPIEILISGGVLDLDMLENYNLPIDVLSFRVEIEKLHFTDHQVSEFMTKANLINSYYSYNEVLKLLLEKFGDNGINRENSSSETFIAWHHIHRVNSFITTYDFKHLLQLVDYDPLQFLEKRERLTRLENRASTLFTKELEKGKKGKMLDRNAYCQKYVSISKHYIELSKKYQPNTVSAFNELVRIFPVEKDLNKVTAVASFYDVFKITGIPSTSQLIYNNFVEMADSVLQRQEYLNALNLITNAREIQSFFSHVEKSDAYSEVYTEALNGLIRSFLKVSVMAYKSRNFKIAQRYYEQAQHIYHNNADFIGDDFRVKHSFSEFVKQQVDIAGLMLEDNYFEDAISLLDQAKNISEQNNFELPDVDFTSAYRKGYSGIYKTLVDSIEYYIEQENRKNSLSALLHSAEFEQSHTAYLKRDERVSSYSLILFDHYMNAGLSKLKSSEPETALPLLLEARNLNQIFKLNIAGQIDSAVSEAFVPIILKIIKKARFEVWAKRMEEANQLREEAKNLSLKYGLTYNEEIKKAFLELDEKANNRVCVSIQFKIDNAARISLNRINSGKFNEAEFTLKTANALKDEHPECRINSSVLDSLNKIYNPLFRYLDAKDSLHKMAGTATFLSIKRHYDMLIDDYETHQLDVYLDKIPALKNIMEEEGSLAEYYEAIQYYIGDNQFLEAFFYLEFLEMNKVNARSTKQYQKKIGYGICKGKSDKKSFIIDLTRKNSWYKYLRSACIRN